MHSLSAPESARKLGISLVTLYKWIMRGKIKAKRYSIGSRDYFGLEEEEVERVKSLIKKDRKRGKSILKEA